MSAMWNAKKELQLAKLMLERENAARDLSLKGAVGMRQCPRFEEQYELTLSLNLARGLTVELFDSLPKNGLSIQRLQEAVAEMAEDVSDIEDRSRDFVEDVAQFRKRLKSGLARLRRKGVRIEGSIGMPRVRVGGARDTLPVLTLTFPGEDLRPSTIEFDVECFDDIDVPLKNVAEQAAGWSRRLAELESKGAVGQIHPLLLHALGQREQPVAETLAAIHADPDAIQRIQDEDGPEFILYWSDGTLVGTFQVSEGVKYQKDRLVVGPEAAAKFKRKEGYTLGELIHMSEGPGADLVVQSARDWIGDSVSVRLLWDAVPFDAEGNILA